MTQAIERLLSPLKNRILNMVARAVVKSIDDSKKIQSAQIEAFKDEIHDEAERFQQYGFTSVPLAGAEAVVVFPAGLRDHPIIIAIDDRKYRKTGLSPGDAAMYNAIGKYLLLKATGEMEGDVLSWSVKADTTIEYEALSVSFKTQKLAIKNALGDGVVELMLEFIDAVMTATTATAIGPQPLVNPLFATIKTRLMAFKE